MVFAVGVVALIWDYNCAYRKNVEEITRKTYGKGKKTEELRVEGKDRILGEIPIEVTEQVYGEQEISQVLKQAVKKMEAVYTESNRHITMNFLQNLKIAHQKSGLYSFSVLQKYFFRYHPNSVSCNIQTFRLEQ